MDKDEALEVARFVLETIENLAPTAIVLNAIARNINSGENTLAYHSTPYKNPGLSLFGITIWAGDIRYNGYLNGPARALEVKG